MMACLNEQELSEVALGNADKTQAAVHLSECNACRVKVAYFRSVMQRLSAAHASFEGKHAAARAQLLAQLPDANAAVRARTAAGIFGRLQEWVIRRRVAAAGIGLSTAAGIAALIAIIVSLATPLSAMERMAKRLREVTSFSFELEETSDRVSGDERRHIQRNDTTFFVAPNSWRGTTRIVKLPLAPTPEATGELLVDVEEIYRPGERGILIDHKKKTFFRTPEMQPDAFPDYSPVKWVQRMAKGSVKVTQDLGIRQLDGKTAHGYVVSLGHPDASSGQNAVQLWVDLETDLPIEFRYEDSDGSTSGDGWTNVMRVYNCRWNVEIDPAMFEPIAPSGYDDTSWPRDEGAIAAMVDALRLYAELSGGHFPRVTEFNGDDVRQAMLRMADSAGIPPESENSDSVVERINRAEVGLDWITQTLRNTHHTGYYGVDVRQADREKVLMWWPVDREDFYQVIYGDLRTEVLPLAEWSKLVPAEIAEAHQPVRYTKPDP